LVNKQFAGKYTEVQGKELLNYKEDKKIPFFITATCKGADLVNIHEHAIGIAVSKCSKTLLE
jgi:hypothetical protein